MSNAFFNYLRLFLLFSICSVLAGARPLRLPGDRGFIRRAESRIVQDALKLPHHQVSHRLLLPQQLLIQRIRLLQLLIRQRTDVPPPGMS
jgi:hypothetical protein